MRMSTSQFFGKDSPRPDLLCILLFHKTYRKPPLVVPIGGCIASMGSAFKVQIGCYWDVHLVLCDELGWSIMNNLFSCFSSNQDVFQMLCVFTTVHRTAKYNISACCAKPKSFQMYMHLSWLDGKSFILHLMWCVAGLFKRAWFPLAETVQ